MSSPELLPLIFNVFAWIFGLFVKFYWFLKYIFCCEHFARNSTKNSSILEYSSRTNVESNNSSGNGFVQGVHYKYIRYLPDFHASKTKYENLRRHLNAVAVQKNYRKILKRRNSESKYIAAARLNDCETFGTKYLSHSVDAIQNKHHVKNLKRKKIIDSVKKQLRSDSERYRDDESSSCETSNSNSFDYDDEYAPLTFTEYPNQRKLKQRERNYKKHSAKTKLLLHHVNELSQTENMKLNSNRISTTHNNYVGNRNKPFEGPQTPSIQPQKSISRNINSSLADTSNLSLPLRSVANLNGNEVSAPQKLANFLSKPFRMNALKRSRSFSKLDQQNGNFDAENYQPLVVTKPPNLKSSAENLCQEFDFELAAPASLYYEPGHHQPKIDQRNHPLSMIGFSKSKHSKEMAAYNAPRLRLAVSDDSLIWNGINDGFNKTNQNHNESNSNDCTKVQMVHSSVIDVPNCFKIDNTIYTCKTSQICTRWVEHLRCEMNPDRDRQRRTENSLSIWILEAKGITAKRRYFCELCLDKSLYARTSTKARADICFWGEFFEFTCIPKVEDICVNLYKEADPKKKKDRSALVGFVQIKIDQLIARHPVERWYTITPASDRLSAGSSQTNGAKSSGNSKNNGDVPAIRVKARYQTVEILPLKCYNRLFDFVQQNYLPLCILLEPVLGVKAKEDLATSLVRVLHRKRLAKNFLCDLIMSEVQALENDHLMFRGNSLATKAMEAYMKLVATDYLQSTLGAFVKIVLNATENCEVDPLKLDSHKNTNAFAALLQRNQHNLMLHAETAWGRILDSASILPIQLRKVFQELRSRLERSGRGDLANNLISSSIFLRFLCPAILSPSLFNLVSEYPSGPAARNLTLIAKTLQTLANFTKFGGKEGYMEFMNEFVEREWNQMNDFLMKISRSDNNQTPDAASDADIDAEVDFGKELSLLHFYLQESWSVQIQEKAKQENDNLSSLWSILLEISTQRVEGFYERSNPILSSNSPSSSSQSSSNLSFYSGGSASAGNFGHISATSETANDCASNNPPSDYENNVYGINSNNGDLDFSKSNHSSKYMSKQQTRSVAENLNTNDPYVLSGALLNDDARAMRDTGAHAQRQRLNKLQKPQKMILNGESYSSNEAEKSSENGIHAGSSRAYHDYYNPPTAFNLSQQSQQSRKTNSTLSQYPETRRLPYVNSTKPNTSVDAVMSSNYQQQQQQEQQYGMPQSHRYSVSDLNAENGSLINGEKRLVSSVANVPRNLKVQQYHIYDDTPTDYNVIAQDWPSSSSVAEQNVLAESNGNFRLYDEVPYQLKPNSSSNGSSSLMTTSSAYDRYDLNTKQLLTKSAKPTNHFNSLKTESDSEEEDIKLKGLQNPTLNICGNPLPPRKPKRKFNNNIFTNANNFNASNNSITGLGGNYSCSSMPSTSALTYPASGVCSTISDNAFPSSGYQSQNHSDHSSRGSSSNSPIDNFSKMAISMHATQNNQTDRSYNSFSSTKLPPAPDDNFDVVNSGSGCGTLSSSCSGGGSLMYDLSSLSGLNNCATSSICSPTPPRTNPRATRANSTSSSFSHVSHSNTAALSPTPSRSIRQSVPQTQPIRPNTATSGYYANGFHAEKTLASSDLANNGSVSAIADNSNYVNCVGEPNNSIQRHSCVYNAPITTPIYEQQQQQRPQSMKTIDSAYSNIAAVNKVEEEEGLIEQQRRQIEFLVSENDQLRKTLLNFTGSVEFPQNFDNNKTNKINDCDNGRLHTPLCVSQDNVLKTQNFDVAKPLWRSQTISGVATTVGGVKSMESETTIDFADSSDCESNSVPELKSKPSEVTIAKITPC